MFVKTGETLHGFDMIMPKKGRLVRKCNDEDGFCCVQARDVERYSEIYIIGVDGGEYNGRRQSLLLGGFFASGWPDCELREHVLQHGLDGMFLYACDGTFEVVEDMCMMEVKHD